MTLSRILGILLVAVVPVSCASVDDGGAEASRETRVSETEAELLTVPCRSSAECPAITYCTTEDGVCNPPPGCDPGEICPAVCYGTCRLRVPEPPSCGGKTCPKGTFCCNSSCGICAPLGGACTQQVCLATE